MSSFTLFFTEIYFFTIIDSKNITMIALKGAFIWIRISREDNLFVLNADAIPLNMINFRQPEGILLRYLMYRIKSLSRSAVLNADLPNYIRARLPMA